MGFLSGIFGYILNFFYNLINNYGIAIIIFSILLRLILIPITIKQQKTMKKSAKIQEKMKEIQNKYKNDPEKMNQETIELYKTEKMSPLSGCFSAILQIVIILSVFWLVSQPLTYMKKAYDSEDTKSVMEEYKKEIEEEGSRKNYPEIQIISKIEEDYQKIDKKLSGEYLEEEKNNETVQTGNNTQEETTEQLESKKNVLEKLRINMNLLGLDLSKVPTQNLNDWKVYIIPLLYVVTSFISIKITTQAQNKQNRKNEIIINEDYKQNNSEEMDMSQMSNSMAYMMPIMSISIAAIAPLGLALYWLVSNVLIILERIVIDRLIGNKEEEEND